MASFLDGRPYTIKNCGGGVSAEKTPKEEPNVGFTVNYILALLAPTLTYLHPPRSHQGCKEECVCGMSVRVRMFGDGILSQTSSLAPAGEDEHETASPDCPSRNLKA